MHTIHNGRPAHHSRYNCLHTGNLWNLRHMLVRFNYHSLFHQGIRTKHYIRTLAVIPGRLKIATRHCRLSLRMPMVRAFLLRFPIVCGWDLGLAPQGKE